MIADCADTAPSELPIFAPKNANVAPIIATSNVATPITPKNMLLPLLFPIFIFPPLLLI